MSYFFHFLFKVVDETKCCCFFKRKIKKKKSNRSNLNKWLDDNLPQSEQPPIAIPMTVASGSIAVKKATTASKASKNVLYFCTKNKRQRRQCLCWLLTTICLKKQNENINQTDSSWTERKKKYVKWNLARLVQKQKF